MGTKGNIVLFYCDWRAQKTWYKAYAFFTKTNRHMHHARYTGIYRHKVCASLLRLKVHFSYLLYSFFLSLLAGLYTILILRVSQEYVFYRGDHEVFLQSISLWEPMFQFDNSVSAFKMLPCFLDSEKKWKMYSESTQISSHRDWYNVHALRNRT